MDQETALDLVKKGSTLLLLDVPKFTLFGIDTQMFSVGPLFKGMKMIPLGTHFIYYSSSNNEQYAVKSGPLCIIYQGRVYEIGYIHTSSLKEGNEFSPTVGFFLTTRPAEVVVRKWHHQEERLIKVSEEEVVIWSHDLYNNDRYPYISRLNEGRYSEAVGRLEFDTHLGPYALDRYGEWKQLSNYITQDIIEKLEPIGGDITIAYESGFIDGAPKTIMEKRLMDQLMCSKFSSFATEGSHRHGCYYTSIPHSVKNKGISGEELTALNIDKTKLLEEVLMKDYGGEEDSILGELQFSFVAFMMGQSLEAFLQWKAMVTLLFSCVEAPLRTRTHLFRKFISVIYYQLKHGFQRNHNQENGAGKGISIFLDEAWFSKNTFLFRLCKDFFPSVLDSSSVDGDLLTWTRKLKRLLETALGWDFADDVMGLICEDDEFSPVIVPSDEAN